MSAYGSRRKEEVTGEVGEELLGEDEDPLDRPLKALLSPLVGGCASRSNIPNPIPASAKSRRMAIFMAASRSLVSVSAREMTGKTLTREDSLRITLISACGRTGRRRRGLVVTGGSRMTGSASGWDTLLVCVRGRRGTGGRMAEGGIILSGSKK